MSTTTDTEPEAGAKSNKKLIIIIAAAAVVVLVAAGLTAFMLLKPKAAEADPATKPGAVVKTENAMTLNLSDGKFLKAGIALQLSEKATADLGGEAAVAKSFDMSKAQDATIEIFGKYRYNQLLDPKTREAAQTALSKEVSKRYEGQVINVYFTEFVMQ